MTEAEWLACEDPDRLLRLLLAKPSDRKLLLLNVTSCRRIWSLLTPRCHQAVEMAESYADRVASHTEYQSCWGEVDFESRIVAQPNPTILSYAVESVLVSIPPTIASIASTLSTAAQALAMAAAERVSDCVS